MEQKVRLGLTALFVDVWCRIIFKDTLLRLHSSLLLPPSFVSASSSLLSCLYQSDIVHVEFASNRLKDMSSWVFSSFPDSVFFWWAFPASFPLFFQQRTTSFCSERDVIDCCSINFFWCHNERPVLLTIVFSVCLTVTVTVHPYWFNR